MSLFNFNEEELITFFMVLVRFSVIFVVLPFIGDKVIPSVVKILLAMIVSIILFPVLVSSKQVNIQDALVWGKTSYGIASTLGMEVLFGLILGYSARLLFEGINLGANLAGNFMGFAAAASFDPHQESQSEVIAQLQTTLAMLIFLALDGHHLMLQASLNSYNIVGMGGAAFTSALIQRLIYMTGEVISFGLQISAPLCISLFSVNIAFGVISRALPQMNVLVLSLTATAMIGFVVMFLSMPGFHSMVSGGFARIGNWMEAIMHAMRNGR